MKYPPPTYLTDHVTELLDAALFYTIRAEFGDPVTVFCFNKQLTRLVPDPATDALWGMDQDGNAVPIFLPPVKPDETVRPPAADDIDSADASADVSFEHPTVIIIIFHYPSDEDMLTGSLPAQDCFSRAVVYARDDDTLRELLDWVP